jgi:hypothetical protein
MEKALLVLLSKRRASNRNDKAVDDLAVVIDGDFSPEKSLAADDLVGSDLGRTADSLFA